MFKNIPRNVKILGLVSFFNDIAAEMIYPIVPIFLTVTLGTPIALLGLIEGIAEATASLTKVYFGYISDYFQKRKPFVSLGYGLGAISKILIGLAYGWPLVLIAKFIDRLGKGVRTAARDSLLLENSTDTNKGKIFGFHRAFDSAGAVLGPLVALFLLNSMHENMRIVFFIAAIPSLASIGLLVWLVKEKNKTSFFEKREKIKISWDQMSGQLKLFLIVSAIFSLGNSSDAFLLLQAKNLGLTTTLVVLVYVTYNISQTVFATPMGDFSDKIGPKKVFALGMLTFSIVYFLFGMIKNPFWLWIMFPIYGIYISATDGVSKAYVAQFITKKESGTYFGLHQTIMSVATFLASFIGGILWSKISPSATFYFGSLMAGIALFLLVSSSKKMI